ncbi:Molybdate-binding periplasmic protein [Defluviimonas aquaemixtae]|uniref:Molybdate-binding periplasmic protein n=1 Tax=Albidovulum aquaemixtae TaxID=1542388 RepID=A0A2R8B7E5_9RHOB|nr:molybdate ABC transporter substrate-binding protein [Defluviimonas aquaemixtae]SPH18452.1 Molybdate-binding periplasmic protein [Defluviimonas aquaemixtae]
MRLLLVLILLALPARAETALIAVATNFKPVAERLADAFEEETGHEIRLSTGATGKLAAQISLGAPFDAFLAADATTPATLEEMGAAVAGTRFTYSIGRLVLWSPDPDADFSDLARFFASAKHVAIANPELAPYGKAAMECIENLGFHDLLNNKIVRGENIGQAFALVHGGAADAGFVAASSLRPKPPGGAEWPVPEELHSPIRQDAVLLASGAENAAASAFLAYLRSPGAVALIESYGYGVAP